MNADAKAGAAYKKGFLRGQALGRARSHMGREQVDPESLLADQIA